jgi:hypothetical protein
MINSRLPRFPAFVSKGIIDISMAYMKRNETWSPGEETQPAEQKEIIKPRKCCGGFKMLHAIQPKIPGINHERDCYINGHKAPTE